MSSTKTGFPRKAGPADSLDISLRQARSRAVPQVHAVRVQQKHRRESAVRMSFDQVRHPFED
jgi:Tfp pilus assembly protein FimT